MIFLLIAGLYASQSFAHPLASVVAIPSSTKIIAEMVLESDPIVRAIDADQEMVFREWLKGGHGSYVKIKNKIQESFLERAAAQGSEHVFDLLLTDLEQKGVVSPGVWIDGRGTPILLSLVSMATPYQPQTQKYERMIHRFLRLHSDQVNQKDRAYFGDGRTALHQAAANGNFNMLALLIQHGAMVNAENSVGETPLHLAARFGKLEGLKLLIVHGAKVDLKTKHTKATPLLIAAESGQETIIRELLYAGAKKTERDVFGKTAPERYKEYVAGYYQKNSSKEN